MSPALCSLKKNAKDRKVWGWIMSMINNGAAELKGWITFICLLWPHAIPQEYWELRTKCHGQFLNWRQTNSHLGEFLLNESLHSDVRWFVHNYRLRKYKISCHFCTKYYHITNKQRFISVCNEDYFHDHFLDKKFNKKVLNHLATEYNDLGNVVDLFIVL